MKTIRWMERLFIAVPLLLLLLFAWTYLPNKILDLESAQIAEIEILNGNSIKLIEITEESDIRYLVDNLNNITFQKGVPSIGVKEFSYRTIFLDNEGEVMEDLAIHSSDTVKYQGFFYKAETEAIAYDFIEELANDKTESGD
ncbi:hypothetical protein SAMN04487975_11144 [Planococcus glaciei]|uniref:hypothetical protein n=1 Tax=Planococcus glaciei TaxID=459472 RepID=UPI000881E192|nr:hypothetical protein [Planococcus glaciei]SDI04020.1 hypothetical protein SAMN04487975_11144 [Planococcus glaciei]